MAAPPEPPPVFFAPPAPSLPFPWDLQPLCLQILFRAFPFHQNPERRARGRFERWRWWFRGDRGLRGGSAEGPALAPWESFSSEHLGFEPDALAMSVRPLAMNLELEEVDACQTDPASEGDRGSDHRR